MPKQQTTEEKLREEFKKALIMHISYDDQTQVWIEKEEALKWFLDFLSQTATQTRVETIQDFRVMLDKHDPQANTETSSRYWGATLRKELLEYRENNLKEKQK